MAGVDKLYEYDQRLNEAQEKAKNESDYIGILAEAKSSSQAKQLAAQLIPRYFKCFPSFSAEAINVHFDLCEDDELGIRIQAIRGLPLLCKDTPEYVPKIVDVLGQLLLAEENLERDAVQKALMSVLRQDIKASLTALFMHIESSDENIREKVLNFMRDKLFSLKAELLQPQDEMERHITDLIKVKDTDHIDSLLNSIEPCASSFLVRMAHQFEMHAMSKDWRGVELHVLGVPFTPNATNSLCGYKIVTGQPSDRLGEDFSGNYKDFIERLTIVEDLASATVKKLNQGISDHNKAVAAATKDDVAKADARAKKQRAMLELKTCNNILAMTQPLHSKSPIFIDEKRIILSWKEAAKPAASPASTVIGVKRLTAVSNGAAVAKKGRGDGSHMPVKRAWRNFSQGGGRLSGRGDGRRGWCESRGRRRGSN